MPRYYELEKPVFDLGGSAVIVLPKNWTDAVGIDTKSKTKVKIRYNSILTIIPPIVEAFKVKIEGNMVWFILWKKKAGVKLVDVRKVAEKMGVDKTLELIKKKLMKKGFSELIPIDKIREKLFPEELEFVEE